MCFTPKNIGVAIHPYVYNSAEYPDFNYMNWPKPLMPGNTLLAEKKLRFDFHIYIPNKYIHCTNKIKIALCFKRGDGKKGKVVFRVH